MAKRAKSNESNTSPPEKNPAEFMEFTLDDPAALKREWNFTDRAERLNRAGHRLVMRGFFDEAADVFQHAMRYDRAHGPAHAAYACYARANRSSRRRDA